MTNPDEPHDLVNSDSSSDDVARLHAAMAVLEGENECLRTLVEGVPQFIWRSRDEGRWTWSSPQWLAYTGQTQEESHGLGWLDALHPDDREETMRAWHEARLHGLLDVEYRVRRAADGAWRWHETRSLPVRGPPEPGHPKGRLREWLGTTTDIHSLKELQAQQSVLLLELQHRTRNILAVVGAIATRSLPETLERGDFIARLKSMGRVQGFLARSGAWSVPLHDLVKAELAAAGAEASRQTMVGGPPVELPGEGVQTLAIALHELATNATKYGALAPANPEGRLSVTWWAEEMEAEPVLALEWRETGVLLPDGPPARRGYGRELIERALPYQLKARTRLEFTKDGVRCTVLLPPRAFKAEEGMR